MDGARGDPGLRALILVVFAAGSVGTLAELMLLEHTEDWWQVLPLVLIGVSCLALATYGMRRDRTTLRVFQASLVPLTASGLLGLYLHYRGNVEFELEMYATLRGLKLFWGALTGATPTLAPGTMVILGALGLIYTHRHPLLTEAAGAAAATTEE
jgi:hypothetical protein